jgi:hypothetical protein
LTAAAAAAMAAGWPERKGGCVAIDVQGIPMVWSSVGGGGAVSVGEDGVVDGVGVRLCDGGWLASCLCWPCLARFCVWLRSSPRPKAQPAGPASRLYEYGVRPAVRTVLYE